MRQLVCEMCGSSDLIKQDGVFVCQSCGCKYSVEEAKKMMVEGTVQVAGTVKIDNADQIGNYIKMANNAYNAKNFREAEEYANKVIEIDSDNSEAWLIKGKACGWQSTRGNIRITESIAAWTNAIKYVSPEDKSTTVISITNELSNLALASVAVHCDSFIRFRTQENWIDIIKAISELLSQIQNMFTMAKVDYNQFIFRDAFAARLAGAAVEAGIDIEKNFGPALAEKTKYAWDHYTAQTNLCIQLLDRAYQLCTDYDLHFTICKNYIYFSEKLRDSCSFKYKIGDSVEPSRYVIDYQFNDDFKRNINAVIQMWKDRQYLYDPEKRKATYDSVKRLLDADKSQNEADASRNRYWASHTEEKKALDSEINRLKALIEECKHEQLSNLARTEYQKTQNEIANKTAELSSLNIFKSKEKKVLQSEIETLRKEADTLILRANNFDLEAESKIKDAALQIQQIETKIENARDDSPHYESRPEPFEIYNADGTFSITGHQLFSYVEKCFSGEYTVGNGSITSPKIRNSYRDIFELQSGNKATEYTDDPSVIKPYRIPIYHLEQSSYVETNVSVFYYALSENGTIENGNGLLINSNDDKRTAQSVITFVKEATIFIWGLTKTASKDDIQNYLLKGSYGQLENDDIIFDDIKLRIKTRGFIEVYITKA